MSGLDDLGRALRDDAAANAPGASVIDVDAVTRAARARRTPRLIGVGTLALVSVLGLGGLAVGALAPPVLIAANESQSSTADAPVAESGDLDALGEEGDLSGGAPARIDEPFVCGADAPAPAPGDGRLRLELPLPWPDGAGEPSGDAAVGTLRLINTTAAALTVRSSAQAEAVVVREGLIIGYAAVTGDLDIEMVLDPGGALDLVVPLPNESCVDASALPAGDAMVLVSAVISVDGAEPVRLTAAPVPVRID